MRPALWVGTDTAAAVRAALSGGGSSAGAKAAELSYAVDIYPFYGSDIGAMWRSGSDIPGALIGPGVHASHGMERTHFDAAANTVALILLYFGFEEPCTEKAE